MNREKFLEEVNKAAAESRRFTFETKVVAPETIMHIYDKLHKEAEGDEDPYPATKKRPLSEMTWEELLVAERVLGTLKNRYRMAEDIEKAVYYRDKEVRVSAELARRVEEGFEI